MKCIHSNECMALYYRNKNIQRPVSLIKRSQLLHVRVRSKFEDIDIRPGIRNKLPPLITNLDTYFVPLEPGCISNSRYLIIIRAYCIQPSKRLDTPKRVTILKMPHNDIFTSTISHSYKRNTRQRVMTKFPADLAHLDISGNFLFRLVPRGSIKFLKARDCQILNEIRLRESIISFHRVLVNYGKPKSRQKSVRAYELMFTISRYPDINRFIRFYDDDTHNHVFYLSPYGVLVRPKGSIEKNGHDEKWDIEDIIQEDISNSDSGNDMIDDINDAIWDTQSSSDEYSNRLIGSDEETETETDTD